MPHRIGGGLSIGDAAIAVGNAEEIIYMQETIGNLTGSCYPKRAGAVTLTGHANAWNDGAWAEVIPAATITKAIYLTGISIVNANVAEQAEIAIGTGTGGSEVEVERIPLMFWHYSNVGKNMIEITPFSRPIKVAANIRVAALYCGQGGGGKTVDIKLHYHELT